MSAKRFLCGLCNAQFAAEKDHFSGPAAKCPECGAEHACGEYAEIVRCPLCGAEQFLPLDLTPGTAVSCTQCSVKFTMEEGESDGKSLRECFPDYEISSLLYRDASGTAYLAKYRKLDRDCVLKILPSKCDGTRIWAAGTAAELQRIKALEYPSLVRIFDLGALDDGRRYIAAERHEEVSLAALMQLRSLTEKEVLSIGIKGCSGLKVLEHVGIPHRRLTPAHILIDSAGGVRIAAPELAAAFPAEYFASPEECRGADPGSSGDLYRMGAVLYHAACGKMPYEGVPAEQVSEAIRQGPPEAVPPARSPELAGVIAELMQRHSACRPGSAAVAAARLGAVLTVPPAGFWKRHPQFRAWLYGFAVLLLVLAGIWCLLPPDRPRNTGKPAAGQTIGESREK